WDQVVALYDQLLAHTPTPVVALNRAVAVAELGGPDGGPAVALGHIDAELAARLDGYHLLHATRADLLVRLGRPDAAAAAYRRARELASNPIEQRFLDTRIAALSGP